MAFNVNKIHELKIDDYKISKLGDISTIFSCHLPSWLSQDGAKSFLLSQLEYVIFAENERE
jgi:hypothetical protein